MTLTPQEPTEHVCQGLWRIPLRSATLPPFTHTNAYLIARNGEAVLVDPGAGDGAAIAMLRDRLEPLGINALQAILLTHTHSDHIAGVGAMRRAFGMPPVFVHPLERDRIAEDDVLAFGEHIRVGDSVIEVLHTPGHSPGHLSFYLPDAKVALVGDVLAGEGTTWVGVPEGDMRDYLETLERLGGLGLERIGPGHGPLIHRPNEKLAEVKGHRLDRERQVLEILQAGPCSVREIRERVYPALSPEGLKVLAEKTLLAHIDKLIADGRVKRQGSGDRARFMACACFSSG